MGRAYQLIAGFAASFAGPGRRAYRQLDHQPSHAHAAAGSGAEGGFKRGGSLPTPQSPQGQPRALGCSLCPRCLRRLG